MTDADIKNTGPTPSPLPPSPPLVPHTLKSTFDQTDQPIRYWQAPGDHRPVLVFLHSWSADLNMNPGNWLPEAVSRNWHFVMPNFRGPNNNPLACASQAAQQDVLDAVTFSLKTLHADPKRVYVAGGSGGGHMTMVMAAFHHQHFAAASEFCGISDLTAWYNHHAKDGVVKNYAQMIAASVSGAPGSSLQTDQQLHARSPLFHIHHAKNLPIDFAHGILDGQTGSVPFRHSIDAFNAIAKTHNAPQVSESEIQECWDHHKLLTPQPQDTTPDPDFQNRQIHMRRYAGPSRLTIFHAGHDGVPHAGCQFLARHAKK